MHEIASRRGIFVLKLGGNAMTEAATEALLAEICSLRDGGAQIVLVHGGGPDIDRELALRKIAPERIDGMRVTDAATLGVVESVLCGTVNKALVRACLRRGIPAVGLSGADGGLLIAAPISPSLGLVGAVVEVRIGVLQALLEAGFVPVIAPLGVAADGSAAYNINADTAAGAIAGALQADAFVLVTNVSQVRRDPDDPLTGIRSFTLEGARAFAASEACRDSMRPKMSAAIAALEAGVLRSVICSDILAPPQQVTTII